MRPLSESVRRLLPCILVSVFAAAWTAAPAHAQWVITPHLGANVAGDVELAKGGPGVSVGYFGGPLGLEFDLQRYQHFFKDSRVSPLDSTAPPNCTGAAGDLGRQPCTDIDTDAVGFMGNIVVPIRSQRASKWRPYGTAGLGVIRGWTNEPQIGRHQNNIGFNTGGGAMYSPSRRVGLRADVRYFRVLVDENNSGNVYSEDYGFWRVTLGVTFGFPR
jgi:opacity protein-like surface antigen